MPAKSEFERFLRTAQPADLGPTVRKGVESVQSLREALAPLLKLSGLPSERGRLIEALILLWHDHLDDSHHIAQEIETADGAFVHGIMHRREPDFGNAAYWFRRVGRHPVFELIGRRVGGMLEDANDLRLKLLPNGQWDPFGFIETCKESSGQSGGQTQLLRAIQQVEFEELLAWLERK